MFGKILIANRGEIACRVMRTCDRMGVRTVAVFSDADRGAAHVAAAGEAVWIGGAAPAESYSRGEAIIEAALSTGAEAIHPGYGFLSENPDFVEAVEAAGLVFIGPSAKAIRAMGLKDAAKEVMERAGVPVVPDYRGDDQDPGRLGQAAEAIGYPVLIKAVAGGGGKGMRLVEAPGDFAEALEACRSEAGKAFGNDRVLVEKFIEQPRHIEVQVFGDGARAVHLYERDCSLQRRHQKVIEEAPAPGMTEDVRAAMTGAAVKAAEAIGYKGAGTVEFIADGSGALRPDGFWFMEMNTRLQVEHPVTEAVTGVDLVEWQLRVAAGEAMPEVPALDGHAVEARLYAEDVPAGFLPAVGRLAHLAFPDGVRADSGVRSGDEISPHYDPMIAKVIAHGATRDEALARLEGGLSGTEVVGTVTNLGFLRRLVRHEGFAAGDVDTGLIGRDLEALTVADVPCSRSRALAFAGRAAEAEGDFAGFALWAPLERPMVLLFGDEEVEGRLSVLAPGRYAVRIGEDRHEVEHRQGRWWVDGAQVAAKVVMVGRHVAVIWGATYAFTVPDPVARGAAGPAAGTVEAPMPGLLKAVFVEAGAEVAEGDRLAVLEAMKMEHVLRAGRAGVVAEVLAKAGDQVAAGVPLVRLEEE
ncbi:biotin carboxylase N-terminal domain-containing protein [Aestuariibius sp. 2305UL40-4]|uniref:ATP-binding protein n=1 Tax=Aestuariibius violaceus TaxID=3234132 RepID=UPI00398E50D5